MTRAEDFQMLLEVPGLLWVALGWTGCGLFLDIAGFLLLALDLLRVQKAMGRSKRLMDDAAHKAMNTETKHLAGMHADVGEHLRSFDYRWGDMKDAHRWSAGMIEKMIQRQMEAVTLVKLIRNFTITEEFTTAAKSLRFTGWGIALVIFGFAFQLVGTITVRLGL